MSRPPPPPAAAQQPTKQPSVGAPPTAQTEDFAAPEAPHGPVEDEIHDLYSSVNLQALMQSGLDSSAPSTGAPAGLASAGITPLKAGTTKPGSSSEKPVPAGSGVAGPRVKGSTPVAPTQPTKPAPGLGSQLAGAIAAPVIGSLLTGGGGIKK